MAIKDVVAQLMEQRGLNQSTLAKLIDVPQPTLHRLMSGIVAEPRIELRQKLCDFFLITEGQLKGYEPLITGGRSDKFVGIVEEMKDKEVFRIPLWHVPRTCLGDSNFKESEVGVILKDRAFFERYAVMAENCIAVEADGDSMAPYISNGDIVIFNRVAKKPVSGKIYLVNHPDGQRVYRVRHRIDGSWLLECDNPDKKRYPDEVIPAGQERLLNVIGEFVFRQGG